jgi:hypothetical protein
VTTKLSPALLDLMEHEKVIEQGLATFVDVGLALLAIRDGKKYRAAGHATFEHYCQARWGFSDSRARRLMSAAKIAGDLETVPTGTVSPTAESQVRPLSVLPIEDRADAWAEAVDRSDGEVPTAAVVAEVVERRRSPQAVPKPTPIPGVPPHPATFPRAVVDLFREVLSGYDVVLDPFAGIGTIHQLRPEHETVGIELEAEWAAASEHTIVGDARDVRELLSGRTVDAVATSPAYGNRLADRFYNAADPEARRSYALDLGRPLSEGSGAALPFGPEYEDLHREVWSAVVGQLAPCGLFVLNCKDFQRGGNVVPVTGWHIGVLAGLGLVAVDLRTLPVAGLAMTTAEKLSEVVVVFRKESR